MAEEKKIPDSLIFILIGIIIGASLVYSYYNLKISRNGEKTPQTILEERPKAVPDLGNLGAEAAAYLKFKEIKNSFIPTGIPDVYGQGLNISFDQVQEAINIVAPFDPTYGQKKITLTGDDLKRYIDVGSQIACEFCCGVKTLVFENGEAACGCDHSQMMRGLAAYLIKNHPEISNEQILEELKKWKITYFPKQTLSVELERLQKAGESGIKELLEEFPEFLPEMVGGC